MKIKGDTHGMDVNPQSWTRKSNLGGLFDVIKGLYKFNYIYIGMININILLFQPHYDRLEHDKGPFSEKLV